MVITCCLLLSEHYNIVTGSSKIDSVQNVITIRSDLSTRRMDQLRIWCRPKRVFDTYTIVSPNLLREQLHTAFTNGNADINGLN
jgi:hypothetical protein